MTAPKRKYHSKTHNGCSTCKRRHVKCDETGPPCANCAIRDLACSYGPESDRHSTPVASIQSVPSSVPSSETQMTPGPDAAEDVSEAETVETSPSQPPPSQLPGHALSMMEMRLMHQWSTSTYLSVTCIPEERELMQVLLPQEALKYGFLLDGMLALAALEIAVTEEREQAMRTMTEAAETTNDTTPSAVSTATTALTPSTLSLSSASPPSPSEYYYAAAEYYDRAIGSFREHLANMTSPQTTTRENLTPSLHLAMLCFSLFAAVLNVALPQSDPDCLKREKNNVALESVIVHFDMMFAAGHIAGVGLDWLKAGPVPTNARPNWETEVPFELLDEGTKAAIERLHLLNRVISSDKPREAPALEHVAASAGSAASHDDDGDAMVVDGGSGSSTQLRPSERAVFEKAITRLGVFFAQHLDPTTKGLAVVWPTLAGEEYSAAVRRHEPLALFILMHWGVLLDRLGKDYWWATRAGKSLVREIAEEVGVGVGVGSCATYSALAGWREGIEWALREVGGTYS